MNTATIEKPVTALSLPQRATVALSTVEHEVKLRELVASSADIVAVVNAAGREQAHRIGMSLKTARVNIEKAGKLAREDATAFSKAVIAEEARLVNIIEPEEDRVIGLRDGFDAEEKARKDALIAAEVARVEAIRVDIESIRNMATLVAGKPSAIINAACEILGEMIATEDRFAEFTRNAAIAIDQTSAIVCRMLADSIASEAAAAQALADRIADDKRRSDEAEQLAKDRAELDVERERAALAAAAQSEIARKVAQAAKAASDRIAAEQAAEAKRLADQAAAQEAEARCQREHAAAEHQAQLDAIHAAGQKVLAQQAAADARDRQAVIDAAHGEALTDNALIDSAIAASARFAEVLAEQLQEEAAFNADDLDRCTATAAECLSDGRAGIDALTDAADAEPDELTDAQVAAGCMALLQCTLSELGDYSIKLMDGYRDDVRRVYAAITQASAA